MCFNKLNYTDWAEYVVLMRSNLKGYSNPYELLETIRFLVKIHITETKIST